jgi:alpha-tubulin suppressor-like RCC1 family protein
VEVVGLTGVTQVTSGGTHTCAVLSTGGLKCWGRGAFGQLGTGGLISYSPTPVDVAGLSTGVATASAGGEHTCAVTTDGGVKCWGYNLSGQIGVAIDNANPFMYAPLDAAGLTSGVAAIVASGASSCALTTGGGVKCWGDDGIGGLGDGNTGVSVPTAVDVVGLSSGVTRVASTSYHTCAILNAGGVKCWGFNYFGQLGNGTTVDSSVPVDATVISGPASDVAPGYGFTCAVVGSAVRCWGDNLYSQTSGDGVAGTYVAVTAGYHHACALTSNGVLMCWGDNSSGQLGNPGKAGNTPVPTCLGP